MIPQRSRIKSAAAAKRTRLAAIAGLGALAVSGALPAVGQAATCTEAALTQPFKSIEEQERRTPAYYSLVAGGAFEAGKTPWKLSGGATVAAGGGISPLTGKAVTSSLELPKGATATSPVICMESSNRSFRFLARGEGATAGLTVSVVYEGLLGALLFTKVSERTVGSGTAFEVSPIMETGVHRELLLLGGIAKMSLRFESTRGTARVDDVYLDPRML